MDQSPNPAPAAAPAAKQSRGRQRIPIQRIESQDDLYATFSKRRVGIYKKASELSTLCGVDIGMIIFSPTNNPYSFFHPSMDVVLDKHMNLNQPPSDMARMMEGLARARIDELNRSLDEVLEQKEKEIKKEKQLDEANKNHGKGWWEAPVESLSKEQVEEWLKWFEDLHSRTGSRIEELKNGAGPSSSALIPKGPSSSVFIPTGLSLPALVPTGPHPAAVVALADEQHANNLLMFGSSGYANHHNVFGTSYVNSNVPIVFSNNTSSGSGSGYYGQLTQLPNINYGSDQQNYYHQQHQHQGFQYGSGQVALDPFAVSPSSSHNTHLHHHHVFPTPQPHFGGAGLSGAGDMFGAGGSGLNIGGTGISGGDSAFGSPNFAFSPLSGYPFCNNDGGSGSGEAGPSNYNYDRERN